MNTRALLLTSTLLSLAILTCGSAGAQQYRPGLPETLPTPDPPVATSHERPGYDLGALRRNYAASREPVILLLLGRTLGARTSEWSADTRETSTSTQQAFQGAASSTTRQTNVRQTETRQAVNSNLTPALQEFNRGFETLFNRTGMQLLHFDAALRRAQRDNELQGRLTREGDFRKNETDAVLAYAELLLEVTSLGVSQVAGVDVESFDARLSRVDTNQVLAQYTTTPDDAVIVEQRWQSGSNGYRRVTDVTHRYQELGETVAYTLFSRALASPIHVIPGSQRKVPSRPAAADPGGRKPRLRDDQ